MSSLDRAYRERARCKMCGGQGVTEGPDEFGNYAPCDDCEGSGSERRRLEALPVDELESIDWDAAAERMENR